MYIKNILLVCQDLQKLNSEFSMITDNLGTSSFKKSISNSCYMVGNFAFEIPF